MNELNEYRINDIKYAQNLLREHTDHANVVLFYESNHYYMSNFSSFMVDFAGWRWPTSEYAYQAAKFDDPYITNKIKAASSSHDAMHVAITEHKSDVREGWDKIKTTIMCNIIDKKLAQHTYIQRKQRQTLGKTLIEDSWRDGFWGRGEDWQGENQLGKCWMIVRDEYFQINK